MARGWESKSVESQIEMSHSNPQDGGKERLSPEASALLRKKETLLLARVHLQRQMEATQHPRHRDMLQSALAEVEKQLADLSPR